MNSSIENRQTYRVPVRVQYKRRRRPKKQNRFPGFLLLLFIRLHSFQKSDIIERYELFIKEVKTAVHETRETLCNL